MEGTPYFPESPENPSIETPEKKKDEKKKKKGFEALLPEKREKEAKKIAESLDKSPLFGEKRTEQPEFEPKHLKQPEAAPEVEAPLETLGEEEKHDIVQELAATRRAEVEQELAAAEPDSPEAAEAAEVIEVLSAIEASGEIDAQPTEEDKPDAEALPFEEESEISLSDTATEEAQEDALGSSASKTVAAPQLSSAGGAGSPPYGVSISRSGFGAPAASTPNVAPNPNLYTSADMAVAEQQAGARGFIVGGIIGYLLGRRRGRIRTERRLLPVKEKLEKEVENLQARIAAREAEVRTFAFERLPEAAKTRAASERLRKTSGMEKPVRAELLGKAVIGTESPEVVRPELRNIAPEHVKDMGRNELLLLSEKVIVEGASLRQIYEQHLIGERGLRHLVAEYLQGKDIRKDLRNEMVEREIDFERDPILRDAAYHGSDGGGTASTSLQQLLEKVGASTVADDPLISVAKLQAAAKEEAAVRKKHRRQLVDTAMVTVIVILATIVTFLLLERH